MKLNKNFLGECVCVGGEGKGVQNKNLPWGEYGYFLELHNIIIYILRTHSPPYISYVTSWKILSKKSRNVIFDDYFLYSTDLPVNV